MKALICPPFLPMRPPLQIEKLEAVFSAMGSAVKGPGRIYVTGGATALLYGWRSMTVDVDLKADPEPAGFFEAIAVLKDQLAVNIELACLFEFIPELPGWQDRSLFIARHGLIDFYHYDPYSQALSKLERGHARDLADVENMLRAGLIGKEPLFQHFLKIEPQLIRYPALDPESFRQFMVAFCNPPPAQAPNFFSLMHPNEADLLDDLPGAKQVRQGLVDFQQGRTSIFACLVHMASPRLIRAGLMEASSRRDTTAEIELYQLLSESEGRSAFSACNALAREVISFQHALDHRLSRQQRPA